jgi:phosphoglycolate phosphatase
MPVETQTPELIAAVTATYLEIYEQNWHSKSQPYAGIKELIAELKAFEIPLTVLSNKPQRFTELCVAHFFPEATFKIVFGQRLDVARKPDPAGASEIATLLGLPPESIAFIGDTKTDICTAVAAGMSPIGVSWGFRPVSELLENGATKIVNHPSELTSLFV